jgi:intracellular septation protein
VTERGKVWIRHFVDYAGLIAFLIVLAVTRSAVTATWGLVAGSAAAIAVGLFFEKRLAPMPLITGLLALFFGGLTLLLHDDRFIKIKPTILYVGFAAFMFGGLAFGKNPLRVLMGDAFNLPDDAARKLTLRYGLLFLTLAIANEAVWRTQSTMTWALFKFPGTVVVIFLFSLAQAPLLMKYAKDETPPTA